MSLAQHKRALDRMRERVLNEETFSDLTIGTAFGGAGERTATAPFTAFNPSEAERGFDDFMGSLVHSAGITYHLDPKLIAGVIVSVAREYAAQGRLPPFPDARASDSQMGTWTAAAITSDFKQSVLKTAQAIVDKDVKARSIGRRGR